MGIKRWLPQRFYSFRSQKGHKVLYACITCNPSYSYCSFISAPKRLTTPILTPSNDESSSLEFHHTFSRTRWYHHGNTLHLCIRKMNHCMPNRFSCFLVDFMPAKTNTKLMKESSMAPLKRPYIYRRLHTINSVFNILRFFVVVATVVVIQCKMAVWRCCHIILNTRIVLYSEFQTRPKVERTSTWHKKKIMHIWRKYIIMPEI